MTALLTRVHVRTFSKLDFVFVLSKGNNAVLEEDS